MASLKVYGIIREICPLVDVSWTMANARSYLPTPRVLTHALALVQAAVFCDLVSCVIDVLNIMIMYLTNLPCLVDDRNALLCSSRRLLSLFFQPDLVSASFFDRPSLLVSDRD